jgi:hypothetical protein
MGICGVFFTAQGAAKTIQPQQQGDDCRAENLSVKFCRRLAHVAILSPIHL